MSAAMSNSNTFSARLTLAAGVLVMIEAPSMSALGDIVGKLGAANDAKVTPTLTSAPAAAAKPTATPAPTAAPAAAGNVPASTGAAATVQPAASGSTSAGEAPRPNYNDVSARVMAMCKLEGGREKCLATLKTFNVDHANKLKLEDYPAFLKAADEVLGAKAAA